MEINYNETKANAVYEVKTMMTVYLGWTSKEVPVEFRILEMPWDKGKTPEQLVKDIERSASVEFSMKKKHLSIEKIS